MMSYHGFIRGILRRFWALVADKREFHGPGTPRHLVQIRFTVFLDDGEHMQSDPWPAAASL
jgi:hypothetical protein